MANDKTENSGTAIRAREDWKAVQERKKNAAIIKLFVGLAMLGAMVGVGVVFKDEIKALFPRETAAPAKVAEKPRGVTPPTVPTDIRKTEIVPPVPPINKIEKTQPPPKPIETISTEEEDLARKLIADGRAMLETFDFEKAQTLFREALSKKCEVATRSGAKTWDQKAVQFQLAIKHIPVSDFAIAEISYELQMQDGSEWVGLKLGEDDRQFQLQAINKRNPASEGRQRFDFPKKDIKGAAVPVSLKERRQQFLELLGALEQSGRDRVQRSSDYYDLVYLSRRLGMGRECIAYLDRAYSGGPGHPADPDLGNSMRKVVVLRAIDKASLMLSSGRSKKIVEKDLDDLKRKLPDFQVAFDEVDAFKLFAANTIKEGFVTTTTVKKVSSSEPKVAVAIKNDPKTTRPEPPPAAPSARELVSDEIVEVVIDDSGVKGHNAASEALVEKANAKFQEAMSVFTKFRQGTNGDNNKILKNALVLFESCIELYDQALAKDPHNKQIEDRQVEASQNCYSCRKYQTM